MATTAQLTIWLNEAEAAYHQIATGRQVKVFVDQNGERVEYSSSSLLRLAAYISSLKQQLGGLTPGPLNVWM